MRLSKSYSRNQAFDLITLLATFSRNVAESICSPSNWILITLIFSSFDFLKILTIGKRVLQLQKI